MSPTFCVTCVRCGKEKWPTLPARPDAYVCALCIAVGADKTAKRREQGQKAARVRKARKNVSGDSTRGTAA